jgi:hypothetical protein
MSTAEVICVLYGDVMRYRAGEPRSTTSAGWKASSAAIPKTASPSVKRS